MGMIIDIFAGCVSVQGHKQMLTKGGAAEGACREGAPGFLQSGRDKDTADKLPKDLDTSRDSKVDFTEFTVLVAVLTSACHKYFEQAGLNLCPGDPDS